MMAPGAVTERHPLELSFVNFPGYAQFIRDNCLRLFIEKTLAYCRQNNLPMLRYFEGFTDDQIVDISMEGNAELLNCIIHNTVNEYIGKTIRTWTENELKVVDRDGIKAEDITLVSYVRRKTFRELLPMFTGSPAEAVLVMEEVDRFTVLLDTAFLNTFIELQNKRIREANEALQKREHQLLEAQAIGNIGSFEWDMIGDNSTVTPQLNKIFSLDPGKPVGTESFLSKIHPEDIDRVRASIEDSFSTGEFATEYRFEDNGQEKFILAKGKVTIDNGIPIRMVGTVMDITEKETIIQRLRESERANREAQALTQLGYWSVGVLVNRVEWSEEMYRIFDLEPFAEPVTFQRFIEFVCKEDRAAVKLAYDSILEGEEMTDFHYCIDTGLGRKKILKATGRITRRANGRPAAVAGTCQDVTREYRLTEKLREREQYLNELNRVLAAKNEELVIKNRELESFNFIASHDLKEPLRKIRIYTNRIISEGTSTLSTSAARHFNRIQDAAGRMQELIDDFLVFSQTLNGHSDFAKVDLASLLSEVTSDLHAQLSESCTRVIIDQLPEITAIRFQIKQLFANLFSNSLKYRREGHSPLIRIALIKGPEYSEETVALEYSDNGIGFETKYEEKIFELFQRLHNKDRYSGTGIGLALCRKVCENHGGTIIAKGRPGEGATFLITLPRTPVHAKTA